MYTFEQLPDTARVWIYQSNRNFSEAESADIRQKIQQFLAQWQSHGKTLKAAGDLYYNRFVVLIADEGYEAPSGCSIDSSVALIKDIEQNYQVDMFDRMHFTYIDGEKVAGADRLTFAQLYKEGIINGDTTVFNNLVATKAEFNSKWKIKLSESWHARMV